MKVLFYTRAIFNRAFKVLIPTYLSFRFPSFFDSLVVPDFKAASDSLF